MAIKRYLYVAPLAAVILACVPASALAAKAQTITVESTPPKPAYVGATFNVQAKATSGLAVEANTAESPSVCTLSGSTVKFIASGSCAVDYNQKGNAEWEKAPEVKETITVVKRPQAITLESTPPSPALVGNSYNLKATASSGLTVSFFSPTPEVCAVSGSTAKFEKAGSCEIDARQTGNGEWEAAPEMKQVFTVKYPQSIKFTSEPKNPAVGGSYVVTASGGGSPQPVVLTVDASSAGVCTLSGETSGSTVSFKSVGTCTIDANQAGSENYEVAPQAQQSFSVAKASQAITFTSAAPSNAVVGGSAYEVKATGGASSQPVVLTIDAASASVCKLSGNASGSLVSFQHVGTCTIDANQAGEADFDPAKTETQSFAVLGRPQIIIFTSSAPSPAYVGRTYTVAATGGESHEPVVLSSPTPSVCTVSGSTVSLLATGVCAINANQAGNAEYAAATQVQQSFTVVAVPVEAPPSPAPPPPTPIIQVQGVKVVGPNSSFRVVGASLSLSTYSITFVESVVEPGTFSWVLTFENGKFGDFARKVKKLKKCKARSIKLKGKCRPARILFAKGSETVTAAGSVTFTVRPTFAGVKALRKAFKQHKGLPVAANVTFQSARGGPAATHVQSLIVKNSR